MHQWHNVSTKFRSNRSAGSQFQMEETGTHSQRKTYTLARSMVIPQACGVYWIHVTWRRNQWRQILNMGMSLLKDEGYINQLSKYQVLKNDYSMDLVS